MEEIAAKLVVYGPLGVICVILLLAVIKLYNTLTAERAARDAKIEAQTKIYIEKAESWTDKYHELLQQTNTVLDRLIQRMK